MPGAGDAWHGRRHRALSARQWRPARVVSGKPTLDDLDGHLLA